MSENLLANIDVVVDKKPVAGGFDGRKGFVGSQVAVATVARTPVTHSNRERLMAHDRNASPEYIKQRGVNIELFAPASSAAKALESGDFAVKFGPDLWMPFKTVNAPWAAARFADRDLRANKTFSTVEPTRNRFLVDDYIYVGEQILAHFENGLDGWRLSGQAVSNYNQHANYAGQWLIRGRSDSGLSDQQPPQQGKPGDRRGTLAQVHRAG